MFPYRDDQNRDDQNRDTQKNAIVTVAKSSCPAFDYQLQASSPPSITDPLVIGTFTVNVKKNYEVIVKVSLNTLLEMGNMSSSPKVQLIRTFGDISKVVYEFNESVAPSSFTLYNFVYVDNFLPDGTYTYSLQVVPNVGTITFRGTNASVYFMAYIYDESRRALVETVSSTPLTITNFFSVVQPPIPRYTGQDYKKITSLDVTIGSDEKLVIEGCVVINVIDNSEKAIGLEIQRDSGGSQQCQYFLMLFPPLRSVATYNFMYIDPSPPSGTFTYELYLNGSTGFDVLELPEPTSFFAYTIS